MVSEGDQHNNGRWLCLCLCASELLELGPRTRAGNIWASSTSLNEAWLRCTDRCPRRIGGGRVIVRSVASQKDWAFSRTLRLW